MSTSIQIAAVALQERATGRSRTVSSAPAALPALDVEVREPRDGVVARQHAELERCGVTLDGLETEVEIRRSSAPRDRPPSRPTPRRPGHRSSGGHGRGAIDMLARCSSASCSGSTAMSRCARTGCDCCAGATPASRSTASTAGPRRRRVDASPPRSGRSSTTSGRSPTTRDTQWKWRNGDIMLSRWFTERGETPRSGTRSFLAQWDLVVVAPLADAPAAHGRGRHAHLRRAPGARGRAVVAVDARRGPPGVRRLHGPRHRALRPGRGPHVLPVHRPRGPSHRSWRATPASTSPSSGSSSTRSPSTRRSSASRSCPTPASGRGGPKSPPRPAPRAPRASSTPGARRSGSR